MTRRHIKPDLERFIQAKDTVLVGAQQIIRDSIDAHTEDQDRILSLTLKILTRETVIAHLTGALRVTSGPELADQHVADAWVIANGARQLQQKRKGEKNDAHHDDV